ncbi:MAG TPA: Mur ligase family protein, partial [Streptosporangiaceae bacterium]|nr:Mur ligase family protein [Streptosporangiaceae bacterium]
MTDDDDALREVEREILSRRPESSIEPSLDRIATLAQLLGDPQRAYPVIHITGTNGKTSTARMIDALLRARGLRTGRFTSPHLVSIRERICIDGQPIDAEQFVALYRELEPYLQLTDQQTGTPLSFFEVLTGMAFAAFADAPVDVAVIEVGLGGTWDATNIADGAVAVVTPVSLDHTQYLGETVEEIAEEKAGIIKPGALAVLAQQSLPAAEVLLRRVSEV